MTILWVLVMVVGHHFVQIGAPFHTPDDCYLQLERMTPAPAHYECLAVRVKVGR